MISKRYDLVAILGLIFSLFLLLCFDYLGLLYQYDQWRVLSLCLLICILVVGGFDKTLFSNIPSYILLHGFFIACGLFFFGFLSSIFSLCSWVSFWCALDALVMFACVFFLCHIIANDVENFIHILVMLITLVLLILSVQFIVGYFAGLFAGVLKRSLFFGHIVNVRFLNQFQTIAIPLVFLFSLNKPYNKFNILSGVLVVQFVVLFVFGSRGSFVGLFACLLVGFSLGVLSKKALFKLGILFGLSFLIYIAFFIVMPLILDHSVNLSVRTSSSGRDVLWRDAMDMLRHGNLLLGSGGMSFTTSSMGHITSHPHNFLIHVLAEWGILMTSLVFWLLFLSLNSVYKFYKAGAFSRYSVSAVTLAIVAGLVHGLFSGIFIMPIPQILMLVLCSIYLTLYINEFKYDSVMGCSKSARIAVVVFLGCSMVFVAIFALLWRFNIDGSYRNEVIQGIGPRYWVDGFLTPLWCE